MHLLWRYFLPFFLLSLVLLSLGCSSLLYYPSRELFFNPHQLSLNPDELWIPSGSHQFVHGWYFHAKDIQTPKGVVVVFHGNGENLSSHYLDFVWLLFNGYDFYIFDYRGYGKSPGTPSPEGTLEDGKSVLAAIFKRNSKLPMIVFGQSLGGNVAIRAAIEVQKDIPIQLMVIESSFLSYQAAARGVLARNWLTWIFQPLACLVISDSMAPKEQIAKISPIPLVVIHGDRDQIVNFSLGQELYQLAQEPKEFWSIPGGGHIDSLWRKNPNTRLRLLNKLDSLFCRYPCLPKPLDHGPTI